MGFGRRGDGGKEQPAEQPPRIPQRKMPLRAHTTEAGRQRKGAGQHQQMLEEACAAIQTHADPEGAGQEAETFIGDRGAPAPDQCQGNAPHQQFAYPGAPPADGNRDRVAGERQIPERGAERLQSARPAAAQ